MQNNQVQTRPYWLMMTLSIIVIIFGIITICAPSVFWKFMDIILGVFLFTSGISAIINAVKGKGQFVWILGIGGVLLTLIGFGLIFSWSQVVGTIMIRIFALWALIRGAMLVIFGLNSKDNQPLWWGIVGLGGFLFVLAIIIALSDKSEARTLAGICIGVSTVIDGIYLLVMALKIRKLSAMQIKLISQAEENEIGQGDVVVDMYNDNN